jgi:Mn-containing catalase
LIAAKVQNEKSVSAVIDPLRWLRERVAVHFQRFGENLDSFIKCKDSKRYLQSI